ncbi:MAG: outer membrane lipoprotein carrier protein [Glaciecola sp.]|jgi:outer membrane lipoprotein carrier protein
MLTRLNKQPFSLRTLVIAASKYTAIISLSIVAITSQALASETVNAEPAKAKAELKTKLSHLISYSASFSQSISDATGKELQSSSGKLTLKTPNQLRWETELPDETLLIADGTTVWNVDPFVEQITVMHQHTITQNNPLMLLVSDDEQQWSSVEVKKLKSGFLVNSNDENANIVSLVIEFNGNVLSRLQSTDRQQQKSLLVFSDIKQNQDIDASQFIFEVTDNYIIDDQRTQQ